MTLARTIDVQRFQTLHTKTGEPPEPQATSLFNRFRKRDIASPTRVVDVLFQKSLTESVRENEDLLRPCSRDMYSVSDFTSTLDPLDGG